MAKAKHKSKKAKPLRSLPVDLQRLADAPIEVIQASVSQAVATALSVFDTTAAQKFVSSGKQSAPMGTHIAISKRGVKIRHGVSARALSISDLRITPALSHPTTGASRQRVTAEGRRGREIEVPRGFIWNGTVFMRNETGRKIAPAKGWLIAAGADPSPAAMLGEAAPDVMAAETDALMRGFDDAGKDGE